MTRRRAPSRGVTLVETVVSIAVLGVVGAMTLPIVHGATDAYAGAVRTRATAERAAYALERTVRLLRDCPVGGVDASVGVVIAEPQRVRFSDGRGLELSGTTLRLRAADGSESTLCEGVEAFVVEYLADDGVTSAAASPALTQRFGVRLRVGEFELRTAVMARARMTG
ncbi:MAG: prepilin-type N-terminal cleavage/methylation domain-containing protein [Planctomycetota bacterium]|nr:prepilin-type N-terminal cleavage/methylation domain-containing protein [Planctomycetota bacterium]